MKKVLASVLVGAILSTAVPVSSPAQNCGNTSVGLTPIDDLGTRFYRGWQGGLYPDGRNTRPVDHQIAGEALAAQIRPLNLNGQPDQTSGRIVLLSIGMSNTFQEFVVFKGLAASLEEANPSLLVVNGAQPGKDIGALVDRGDEYWRNLRDSLSDHGASALQVQAIWFKQAEAFPTLGGSDTSFHNYVIGLKEKFVIVMNTLRTMFPNARVCYIASRSYGGYANILLNPEPFAYYTGWAVKKLIEDQINGVDELSYDEPNPRAPWLSWGVYIWADGMRPRGDGLIWRCSDFQQDGTHPSESGEIKVATDLMQFFTSDSTTRPWFMRSSGGIPCEDIDIFDASCNDGTLVAMVGLQNSTQHAGKSVEFALDDEVYRVGLTTNGTHTTGRLRVPNAGFGEHRLGLVNPPGCFSPITVRCQMEAGSNPALTMLHGNYPNPFNPSTSIRYVLAEETFVTLRVYNTMGQEVATLVNEVQTAGERSIVWDGKTGTGTQVASGIYLCTLVAGDQVRTARMIILK